MTRCIVALLLLAWPCAAEVERAADGVAVESGPTRATVAQTDHQRFMSRIAAGDEAASACKLTDALGAYREALAVTRRLVSAAPNDLGPQADLARALDRIASVLAAQGDTAGAVEARYEVGRIRARIGGADPDGKIACPSPPTFATSPPLEYESEATRGFTLFPGGKVPNQPPNGHPTSDSPDVYPRSMDRGSTDPVYHHSRSTAQMRELTPFPWPPPTPSERVNLMRSRFLAAIPSRSPTLWQVGDHIIAALQAAGYAEYSLYQAPAGFAIVSRLERVEPDGRPAPEGYRFLEPGTTEPFSLASYIAALFFAPQGYYRQIVFVVTPAMVRPGGPTPTVAVADRWLLDGADRLPAMFKTMPFSDDHQVTALIYEYRKGTGDHDARTLVPGRLGGRTNLERAGLYQRLMAGGRTRPGR